MSRRPVRPGSMRLLGAFGCGYALGLVPSADAVARRLTLGELDLRASGHGNPGALNAYRLLGRRAGLVVAVADIGKGVLACAAGRAFAGVNGAHSAGVGAVAGHCYPLTRGCRGGVGAATSFGQCLATFPAFAAIDAGLAIGVTRVPGLRWPVTTALAVSSTAWIACGLLWWKRRLPNLWGPEPTVALPLANAATAAVIASRGFLLLRRRTFANRDPA